MATAPEAPGERLSADFVATLGSLFAGVGGFDLGFEAAGFRTQWQAEIDPWASKVLARHWPDATLYGDVTELDGAQLAPVDVITFGSPCQDMSLAGERAGLAGERSGLFHEAVRIIGEMREATDGRFPAWAVWENVCGALSSSNGADFGRVLDVLADVGAVELEWRVLDSRFFGVPQRRRRLFLIAGFHPRGDGAGPVLLVGESHTGHPAPTSDLVGFYTAHGKYDVPVRDGLPPLTIKTGGSGGHPAAVVGTALAPRRLTARESERAMGWPDDHTRLTSDGKEIADSQRWRMCANGVVAPVAEWVARRLLAAAQTDGPDPISEDGAP